MQFTSRSSYLCCQKALEDVAEASGSCVPAEDDAEEDGRYLQEVGIVPRELVLWHRNRYTRRTTLKIGQGLWHVWMPVEIGRGTYAQQISSHLRNTVIAIKWRLFSQN